MDIAKRWSNYCDQEVSYATEDDWNNFVLSIYSEWCLRTVQTESHRASSGHTQPEGSVDQKSSFDTFIETAQEYQELCAIDSVRCGSLRAS